MYGDRLVRRNEGGYDSVACRSLYTFNYRRIKQEPPFCTTKFLMMSKTNKKHGAKRSYYDDANVSS